MWGARWIDYERSQNINKDLMISGAPVGCPESGFLKTEIKYCSLTSHSSPPYTCHTTCSGLQKYFAGHLSQNSGYHGIEFTFLTQNIQFLVQFYKLNHGTFLIKKKFKDRLKQRLSPTSIEIWLNSQHWRDGAQILLTTCSSFFLAMLMNSDQEASENELSLLERYRYLNLGLLYHTGSYILRSISTTVSWITMSCP